MNVYSKPLYYEIAFSFIDVKKQVALFEKFIQKYSKIKVRRVLDIACGPSPQLIELAKRGYKAIGLDISLQMLKYLQQKAKEEKIKIETIKADMRNFKLKEKVDFAFILMGSFKFKTNEELLNHLDSVSNSLRNGGLYLIENMELEWPTFRFQTWTVERDGIKVKVIYKLDPKNPILQTFEEKLILEVDDHGKKLNLIEKKIVKYISPQEFLTLIKLNNKFEFLGWFERLKFKKLKRGNVNNIIVLRKKYL